MHVADELQEVGIFLAEHGLVAVAEEVSGAPVSEVEADAVSGQQSLHAVAEWGAFPPRDEVKVISHQDEREKTELFLPDHGGEAL